MILKIFSYNYCTNNSNICNVKNSIIDSITFLKKTCPTYHMTSVSSVTHHEEVLLREDGLHTSLVETLETLAAMAWSGSGFSEDLLCMCCRHRSYKEHTACSRPTSTGRIIGS